MGNLILGIHDGHNASVCLLEDGKTKWLIQEERLRRIKNYDGFPQMALERIFSSEEIGPGDIDSVVLNGEYMPRPMNREELLSAFKNYGRSYSRVKNLLKSNRLIRTLNLKKNQAYRFKRLEKLGFERDQIGFVEHHLCHAASAYFGNACFDEPILVLTNDGAGDRICGSVNIGSRGAIERLASIPESNSIGLLYAMFTFLTGMVPLEHEYKLMGMAPYADQKGARSVADELHKMFQFSSDGLTWSFTKGKSIYGSREFFRDFLYLKRFDHVMAGLQLFTEEFLVAWVRSAIAKTRIRKLVLAGGTFMNVKANQKIMEMPEVENVFVFPSCGDESNSFGAAIFEYNRLKSSDSIRPIGPIYWGDCVTNDNVFEAFKSYPFKNKYDIRYADDIEDEIANLLNEGLVVARFKGREEFGARSLGNRAIIANPSTPGVIKQINEMIKNRDFWMPFASSIAAEFMDRYIDWDSTKNDPRYMIMTFDTLKNGCQSSIAGGIHPYDKSVRPQMVFQEDNPEYWKIITKFSQKSGIGAVLNTSLNLHGLPLVSSPQDAFEVIDNSGLRYLAIENYLIKKL